MVINELRDRAATLGSDYLTDEEWIEVIDRLEEAETAWKEADKACRDLTEKVIPNLRESLEAAETAWKEADKACRDLTEKVIPNLRESLEAAEKETASWKGLAKQFGNEADALRAAVRHEADCVEAAKAEIKALRSELADLRSSMAFRTSLVGRTEAERDALRAKITEMEKQEPAGTLHDDGCFVWRETAPHQSNYAGWKMALYALPGAKEELK